MRNDISLPPEQPRDDLPQASEMKRPDPLPHAGDVVVNGKAEVLYPRVNAKVANDTPRAHIDGKEPGHHHARTVGEATKTDPLYAMPMEERGSTFNIALTLIIVVVFITLVAVVWISLFR